MKIGAPRPPQPNVDLGLSDDDQVFLALMDGDKPTGRDDLAKDALELMSNRRRLSTALDGALKDRSAAQRRVAQVDGALEGEVSELQDQLASAHLRTI